jgi:hypothetical protein
MPIHQRSQRRNLPSRLTDHDRREASEAGRFSPSPPSAVSSSPSRIEEQRPEPLVTASSRPWRPYERRCRPSAFRRGRKESGRRLRFLSFGAGISSHNPSRSASASAVVAWWNGMGWNGAHRATAAGQAAHHMPLSASAPAFSRLGEKGGVEVGDGCKQV